MDNETIIHLKSGQKVEGSLARSFGINDSEIEIYDSVGKQNILFSLDEICTIRFQRPFPWIKEGEPSTTEVVQTLTGETLRVAVFTNRKFLKGFAGMLEDEATACRTIFITFDSVRYRHGERPIGDILREKNLVSENQLEEALKIQTGLRARRLGDVIAESAELPREEIEKTIDEATRKTPIAGGSRVGDILVEAGLVTREQVEKSFVSQEAGKKVKIGELLVRQGLISEEQLLSALATKFRLRFINLAEVVVSEKALGTISEGLANRLQVIPLYFDDRRLVVATSTPTDPAIMDSLRFCTNLSIELVVAPASQISAAIEKYYHRPKDSIDTLLNHMKEDVQSVTIEEEEEEAQVMEPDSEVIALINRILLDAYRRGASDIHFEPGSSKKPVIVRYRIDGDCLVAHRIAATFKSAIIARIKIIAGLDISERRRPQSGKILLRFEQRKLEYRVEITPTVGGQEDAVLRLLAASKPLPLSEMGFIPHNLERFKGLLAKPYGIILCVGPTGSGKTTTLHSALGQINSPTRKIWTVEDPVEITQPGLRQVQVNKKIGFGFAEALRSFLRADPDVIMIGEMRDAETAKIAIESSLTGHLVFSTLHTNSAPETVVRLIDMGMEPFNFADALLGVMAQRLARRLCDGCKKSVRPKREMYDGLVADFARDGSGAMEVLPPFEETLLMVKSGCEKCGGSGYKGRVAIHELMVGTADLKSAIRQGAGVEVLRGIALAEGMWTLRMDGIMKIFRGFTDMEQIAKVCM